MTNSRQSSTVKPSRSSAGAMKQEVRCAVRFPLSLPLMVSSGKQERSAVTRNVSSNGVLFELEDPLSVGQGIKYSLRMPGEVLGTHNDVMVHCRGRVVRCSVSQSHYQAAATIDDYRFSEL